MRFLERGRKSVWSRQVKAYASSVAGHAFKIPHDQVSRSSDSSPGNSKLCFILIAVIH